MPDGTALQSDRRRTGSSQAGGCTTTAPGGRRRAALGGIDTTVEQPTDQRSKHLDRRDAAARRRVLVAGQPATLVCVKADRATVAFDSGRWARIPLDEVRLDEAEAQ